MALLDLLGRRWMLRVLWELGHAPSGFRELQARCDGMSPSVLSQRLHELLDAGIISQEHDATYALSESGDELLSALNPLNSWAATWNPSRPD